MARKINAAYQLDIASPLPQPGSLFDFTHWPLLSQNSSVFNCTLQYTMASPAKCSSPPGELQRNFSPGYFNGTLWLKRLLLNRIPSTHATPLQAFWGQNREQEVFDTASNVLYTHLRLLCILAVDRFNAVDNASHTLKVSYFGGTMSYLAGHLRVPAVASFCCWKQRDQPTTAWYPLGIKFHVHSLSTTW